MAIEDFLFANFAEGVLLEAVGAADTSLWVSVSNAYPFPIPVGTEYCTAALFDGVNTPEIIHITDNDNAGTLTVARAQEGSSARAWGAGTRVRHSMTAAMLAGLRDGIVANAADVAQVAINTADITALEASQTAQDGLISGNSASINELNLNKIRYVGTKAAAAAMTIPAIVTCLIIGGFHTEGDGGHFMALPVAEDPGHPASFQSADSRWWEIQPEHGEVNVKQFGAKGDGVTDDHAAFKAAIEFNLTRQQTDVGGVVNIPQVDDYYLLNSPLDIQNSVHLRGQGINRTNNPQLMFAQDTQGVVVNDNDTTLSTTRPAGSSASYSTFENLVIRSLGSSTGQANLNYPGIRLRTKAHFKDVYVHGFPGNGWHINCNAGGGGDTEGNSNYASFINCKAWWNGHNGFFIDGPDANAMAFFNLDAQSNGRFGVWDDSFLGNHYHSWHLSNNGNASRGYNTAAQSALAHYSGNRYSAAYNATEAQLRTTTPGTDENVWKLIGAGGVSSTYLEWSGAAVGTFHAGGPYALTNVNGRGVVIGGYVEGSQAKSFIENRWTVFAGIDGSGTYGDGSRWTGEEWKGDFVVVNRDKINQRNVELRLLGRNDVFFVAEADGDDPNGLRFGWDETNDLYEFRHGTTDPLLTFGNDVVGSLFVGAPKGIRVGTGQITIGSVDGFGNLPSTPRRGDIYFNSVPSAGEEVGWVCLSATGPIWGTFATLTQV